MNAQPKFSLLEVVNATLDNIRHTGYEPDGEMTAFVWKMARREASDEEIAAWMQEVRRRIDDNAKGKYLPLIMDICSRNHDKAAFAEAMAKLERLTYDLEHTAAKSLELDGFIALPAPEDPPARPQVQEPSSGR